MTLEQGPAFFFSDGPSGDPLVAATRLAQSGRFKDAEAAFRQCLSLNPGDAAAHHNYAVFLSQQNCAKEATEQYQHALRLKPRYPEALRNFGTLLANERKFGDACRHLWAAVAIEPDNVQGLATLGNALFQARRAKESIAVYRQAIRLSPNEALLHNQLGLAFFDSGRFEDAEAAFLEALRIDANLVSAHNNLGSIYKAMGRCQEALACFELALILNPESASAKWNRALTLLSAGNFERGWEEYESRWQRPETPFPTRPEMAIWKGEPLEGKSILLVPEQGLGDTIQFIRYAQLLKERGARVFVECQSPLRQVLVRALGTDFHACEGEWVPPSDFYVPLLGLPRVFKTTLASVPAQVPYLVPDAQRVEAWRQKLDESIKAGEFRVGIAWQGNPHHQWDHFRSLPLMLLEPLTRIPGIRLVSLQRGPGIDQIECFQRLTQQALLVPTDGRQATPEDLAESAALMMHMDLIISVDTLPAHLAGALGRPVWTLLSFVADWRWMIDRHDSPWYPTMRLFRQRTMDDWPELVERVADTLGAHLEVKRRASPRQASA